MDLYDYIYVDLEKAISLYSQLTGGVVELRETQTERSTVTDNKRSYDFKVFRHGAGGTSQSLDQDRTTIKPHHALLQELVEELSRAGFMLDLDQNAGQMSLKSPELRSMMKSALCIKCTGRIVIEDYERIKKIGRDFPNIVSLINRSASDALKETDAYKEVQSQISELESFRGDRNKQSVAKEKAKELRSKLERLVREANSVKGVPQWILDGMSTWIDAFLPKITNIRVYANHDEPDEHIFGHLEARNFSIADASAFHFTYGAFPTEPFTILGIVTSVPPKEPDSFAPLAEFDRESRKDFEEVENAFRGVFRGFSGLEAIARTCRYPRVLVHPVLVYRQASPISKLKQLIHIENA